MRRKALNITMLAKTALLILGALLHRAEAQWQQSDRVLLQDVKAITLHQGRMTNGRRSSPVPQLNCVGGSAKHRFQPQTVQCINQGSDGHDVQWECKADMDNAYRFGNIQVSCEGYDSPYDPYILKGSCGLEYTIDLTEEGFQKGYQSGGSYSTNNNNPKSEGGLGGLLTYIGILGVIYIIYQMCIKPKQHHAPQAPPQGPHPPPYGFRQEFQHPEGPPPSYESTQRGSAYQHASAPHEHMSDNMNSRANDGPGFWSGAATGGLLGYMMGNRNRGADWGSNTQHQNPNPNNNSGNWFSSSNPSPSSGSSSGTRTASGFGGTSRR